MNRKSISPVPEAIAQLQHQLDQFRSSLTAPDEAARATVAGAGRVGPAAWHISRRAPAAAGLHGAEETDPREQCSIPLLLAELLSDGNRADAVRAITARVRIQFIERMERRWRSFAAQSGLLFSPHLRLAEIEAEGHKRISLNGYTEAPITVGRYAALLASGAFDGYVNVGAFNCAPANTASAVIQTLSHRTDTPYAVIEADGDSFTPGQLRQLETIAIQCRRRRAGLNEQLSA